MFIRTHTHALLSRTPPQLLAESETLEREGGGVAIDVVWRGVWGGYSAGVGVGGC